MSWEFHPSPWSVGTWAVRSEPELDGAVTCYVPPGTSLYGDSGLDVAVWRRAAWHDTGVFAQRRRPDRVARVTVAEVCAAFPEDMYEWIESETAAHVERLRAFARARPHADVADAVAWLCDDLEHARPGALERFCLEADDEALRRDAILLGAGSRPLPTRRDRLKPRAMTRRQWVGAAAQIALIGALYALYRVALRPADAVASTFNPAFATLPSRELREVLVYVYGWIHIAVPVCFLVWLYFRRNSAFDFVRNALVIAAALVLVGYLVISLTASAREVQLDPAGWVPAAAVPTTPAFHLAVAIVIGWSGARLFQQLAFRLCALLYPIGVAGVVVVSAPRWPLVTLAAALAAAIVGWLAAVAIGMKVAPWRRPPRLAAHRRTARRTPPQLESRAASH